MHQRFLSTFRTLSLSYGLLLLVGAIRCFAGGVTFITHGLNGNVDGWIAGMANELPKRFPGTGFTCYKVYFYASGGGSYSVGYLRVAGGPPLSTDSGEIIVEFDWSQLANGNSYNTYQIAGAAVPALLSTTFIPELGGHALAEFPLHLVGHSRGGSLVCEMSRLLGLNGVWVDHLTTLDPHPLNNDGFSLDALLYSDVDAPAHTYSNVLFHDNYWQNLGFLIDGEPVQGAYSRQLSVLSGGYNNIEETGADHSNVHLWYHGTIDLKTPTSDTTASITSAERSSWWTPYESLGAIAGFYYSLIGGGDRLGFLALRQGYNQAWDLGAGSSANRVALSSDSGEWPNLIKFNRTETNPIVQGQSMPVKFFYQWAQPNTSIATVSFFLDDDFSPLNGNQVLLQQFTVPGTGSEFVGPGTANLTLNAGNATPGYHTLYAQITGGGRTRYLYAPERVQVVASVPVTFTKTTYSGIFYAPGQISPPSSGAFVVTTTATGKFTGKFQTGSASYSKTGVFDASGQTSFAIVRRNMPTLSVTLQLQSQQGENQITGTVTDGTWSASLAGNSAAFDGKTTIAPQSGNYTLILAGTPASATQPGGDSYGTATVDKMGRVRLIASFAEGTKASQAAMVSLGGEWPLYVPLNGGAGLILSWITFSNAPSTDLTGDLVWIKSVNASAKYYPAGFAIETTVSGSAYTRQPTSNNLIGVADGSVVLSGADLAMSITNIIVISPQNKVSNLSSNLLSLSFTAPNGTFRGRVLEPATRKMLSFSGVVLQKQNSASGYFLTSSQSGRIVLGAGD